MNIWYALFELGPAIMKLYEFGVEASSSCFMEFSEEYYVAYYKQNPDDVREKRYIFTPLNISNFPEIWVCNEREMKNLIAATDYIENLCVKHNTNNIQFANFQAKLEFASTFLPPVFSGK